MIRIIVGLGNPGQQYANTRHNIGFMALDRLAAACGAVWKLDKSYKGEVAHGPGVLLVKPQTYMNDSGSCVGPLMRYFKFAPEQVLVIYDELSFPLGTIKMREKCSAAGHNGIRSLIAHLGSEVFPRIRIGIGHPTAANVTKHVLGSFSPDEKIILDQCLTQACAAAKALLDTPFSQVANLYNTPKVKKEKKAKTPQAAPTENTEKAQGDTKSEETAPLA